MEKVEFVMPEILSESKPTQTVDCIEFFVEAFSRYKQLALSRCIAPAAVAAAAA